MLSIKQSYILTFLLFIFMQISAHANVKKPDPLFKSSYSTTNQIKLIGRAEPESQIDFIVKLKLRNASKLDSLVEEIYNPQSKNYQKYLNKEQFDLNYAPSNEIEKSIQEYFISKGMNADIVNHSIRVTGSVHQIEQVFQTKMNKYNYRDQTVYANETPPILSSDLAQYVSEITGLSKIPRFHPMAVPTNTSLNSFTGSNLSHTYNLANIASINGTKINGAGQTIVLVDACGTNSPATIMSDANAYNTANGIVALTSSNFAVVTGNGAPFGSTTCTNPEAADWAGEIALDVEAAHTIAPGANIVLVLAANGDVETALEDIISYLIAHNYTIGGFSNAMVISNSWGGPEASGESLESHLVQASASGLSVNFSTGDCGDNTYNSAACSKFSSNPTVDYPASSTYVTAIGGSSLFVDASWNYAFETPWGTYYEGAFYFGSTGGISKYYGPASWQSSISTFTAGGYTAGTVGHYNKRALPDISMLGDPVTGLIIYFSGSSCNNGCAIGGTSLASPLFTATLALVNQERFLLAGKAQPIGQAAPYLYTFNNNLVNAKAVNVIIPPHQIISSSKKAPSGAPLSAFTISGITFGWNSSLTVVEKQFWSDAAGIGSPNIPNFVSTMAGL